MEVLVFGGTTEGRRLAEWLGERNTCAVTYCTATDYGASLVAEKKNVVALRGPLSHEQKARLMTAHDFACIVDATHPYAQRISISIDELAQTYNKDVVRIERASANGANANGAVAFVPDASADVMDAEAQEGLSPSCASSVLDRQRRESPPALPACLPASMAQGKGRVPKGSARAASLTTVATAEEAAHTVAAVSGNVLLTTGTKDLASFVEAMPDYRDRLYARILPVEESLAKARGLGIPASHLVAMQGPFSTEFNCALIREFDIGTLVTKQAGQTGGFAQKAEAARICGIDLVVIERPGGVGGMSLDEAMRMLEDRYGL